MKGGNESNGHYRLKRAALIWLHGRGARTIAFEVPVLTPEYSRMRIDVAAWDRHRIIERSRGPRGGRRRRRVGDVDELIAVECKASRADFLKDSRNAGDLREELARLDRERERLEEHIRRSEPELRFRRDLFTDEEIWKYERTRCEEYLALVATARRLSKRLHAGTKFDELRRASLFHRHYVCAAPGLVEPCELPPDWGLLEQDENSVGAKLVREAPLVEADDFHRPEVVRRLAQAGTRALLLATGLQYGEAGLEPVDDEDSDSVNSGGDAASVEASECLEEEVDAAGHRDAEKGGEPSEALSSSDDSPRDEEKAVGVTRCTP